MLALKQLNISLFVRAVSEIWSLLFNDKLVYIHLYGSTYRESVVFANLVEYHVLTKSDPCMLRMVKLHFAGTYTMLRYVGLSGNGKEGLV